MALTEAQKTILHSQPYYKRVRKSKMCRSKSGTVSVSLNVPPPEVKLDEVESSSSHDSYMDLAAEIASAEAERDRLKENHPEAYAELIQQEKEKEERRGRKKMPTEKNIRLASASPRTKKRVMQKQVNDRTSEFQLGCDWS